MIKIKINRQKNHIMVIDVETTDSLKSPLIYDLGFVITDQQGIIYKQESYLVREIFYNLTLMKTAYYAKKIPLYLQELELGLHKILSFKEVRENLLKNLTTYNVNQISAYNLNFDLKALTNTTQYLKLGKKFLTPNHKNIKMKDIWSFANETIFQQKTFHKIATREGWTKKKTGNVLTNAEIAYRYITGNYKFIEDHQGLKDALIETEILAKCYRQKKKHKSGILNDPWKLANTKKWKDFREKFDKQPNLCYN